ncbi:MAG: phosphonoacetaldehyde hydrolase [Planctomycetota bacterium]|jgi:phosphonoacetaldehyde hydrolase|nr:phosphonoacetaldehyde hydrolase [Planctomycetota bacterium]
MNAHPLSLVVCDLAGTTVDYGSRAPLEAFREVFARRGVTVTDAEARGPMGMHKRDHMGCMLSMPSIAHQWRKIHGRDWNADDLDALFREFLPLQTKLLETHSEAIPGAIEAVAMWRSLGIKVAAATGYTRPMADLVLAAAERQGLAFDFSCCAAETPAGRPAPWMIYHCMEAADAYPPATVLKIGDTIADVEEGTNAGVWTVGVAMSGNMLGLTRREAEGMNRADLAIMIEGARKKLAEAGAHLVVDSIAEAPLIASALRQAIAGGGHPGNRGLLPPCRSGPAAGAHSNRDGRPHSIPFPNPYGMAQEEE